MGSHQPTRHIPPIYTYSFRFVPTTSSEWAHVGPVRIDFESTESDPDAVKEEALARLGTSMGVTSPEQGFRVQHRKVGYSNPPWGDDYEVLEQTLRSLSGVKSIRYEDPYEGAYRAPRYHLTVDAKQAEDVKTAIEHYYGGLHVRRQGSHVKVVTSVLPPQNW